jgi:hypothetical protein
MNIHCPSCKTDKDEQEFYATNLRANGRAGHCKLCHNRRRATAHVRDPRIVMLVSARSRAKRKGLPFTIALGDIVIPTVCPVLGIPLSVHTGKRGAGDTSPSLDAIVPTLGYVAGNVQVISKLANAMKNKATMVQLEQIGLWARDRRERAERYTVANPAF